MAVNGTVTITWGDGEHEFNIARIKSVLELEDKCGCGVAEIFDRLRAGRWRVNDIRETLRLSLIGGGLEPPISLALIERYFDGRPFVEGLQPAMLILMAAMVGVPGEDVGKKAETEGTPEGVEPSSAPMADSSAPSSTDSQPASDSILEPQMS